MNAGLTYLNEIDRYQNGTLSPKELHDFQQMMDNNALFVSELKLQQSIDEAIQDTESLHFERVLTQLHHSYSKERVKQNLLRVAASLTFIMVIGGIFWLFLPNVGHNYARLADQYYKVYDPITAIRSGDQPSDQLLAEAFDLFTRKDFTKAANKFKDLLNLNPSNNMARFYLGISLMETGKPAEAIPHMQEIILQKDVLFQNQAEWYMALCFLKTNEKEKAIGHLKNLVAKSGHYKVQAQKLIKELK